MHRRELHQLERKNWQKAAGQAGEDLLNQKCSFPKSSSQPQHGLLCSKHKALLWMTRFQSLGFLGLLKHFRGVHTPTGLIFQPCTAHRVPTHPWDNQRRHHIPFPSDTGGLRAQPSLFIAGMIQAAGPQTEKQPKVHPHHCWLRWTSYPLRTITLLGLFALNSAWEDRNQSPELILHLHTHCHGLRSFQCLVKPKNNITEQVMAWSYISMQAHVQGLRSRGGYRVLFLCTVTLSLCRLPVTTASWHVLPSARWGTGKRKHKFWIYE